MKKPTVIIGKRQIILSCLTLILGIAVYLNYVLADGESLMPKNPSPGRMGSLSAENSENAEAAAVGAGAEGESLDGYGAAELVNASANADFFAQARMEKQTSRDQAVETLQSIIGGGDLSDDEMVVNAIDAVSVSKQIESESVIESLILAQGFSDCVVYLDGTSAKIDVESNGLEAAQAAAIKDIVLTEAEVPAEGIRIFEVASQQ
ncbi:MAG: SpoIIIAH-like family protein [Oscillospiraceae bacterium]|nr:SpoIIIAH-like family protein [Oscillospiraceae bacterium]